MRLFRRGRRPEEQYRRYQTAREAVTHGVLPPDHASIQAARAEMLETMGPAFDPTTSAWGRLAEIDAGFYELVTSTIDPAQEDPANLDAFAEQVLAIVGLGISDVTGEVIVHAANNFVETVALEEARRLESEGYERQRAQDIATEEAKALALRYFAFARLGRAPLRSGLLSRGRWRIGSRSAGSHRCSGVPGAAWFD